jgi:hypothetical protein
MSAEFSFLGHPAELLLRNAQVLLPGIRRIEAVFYHSESEAMRALMMNADDEQGRIEEVAIDGAESSLEKLRKVKTAWSWLSVDDVPFRIRKKSTALQDVFGELNKTVLLIRIPNDADNLNDLLFIYFPENLSNFGVKMAKKELTAEYKDIIARTLINSINTILQISKNDRDIWGIIKQMSLENRNKMQQKDKELERVQKMYEDRLAASCNYYLSEISAKEGNNYTFSPGALKLLKTSTLDYYRIENAIKLAVQLANNFTSGGKHDTIEITEDFLNFNASEVSGETDEITDSIYEKPFNYLNQLEEAALKVKENKMPLTANNLVKHLEKPVAPSAISWAITHYMNSFKQLLKLYPDNWPVIRSEFKPVLRIISPDPKRKIKE